MIGTVVSHYKIIEEIGRGGMGVVYKAKDTKLDRFIALKFLPQEFTRDPEAKKRFIREARAASALDHPNICTIHEIDETKNGQMFICMTYYDAETLKQKIENSPLPIDEAINITIQVCRGLTKAHKLGLIHRDIKPANILITRDGIVKIVDFGLAKLEGQTRLTKDSTTMGTVAYISPEQAGGREVDNKTDIWAAGVILYEMLTGELPFKGDIDQVLIYSILHEKPIPPTSIRPEIPEELELVIEKSLLKETEYRYQRIDEMEKDLRKVTSKNSQFDRSATSQSKTKISFNKKIKKISVSAGILLGLFLAFIIIKPYFFKKATTEKLIPIAVIGFVNQTGNEAYDYLQEAIPNLLITSLEQSPYLHVMTWERMHDLLKQIGKMDIQVIDKEIGFELCHLDGIDVIITGSYVKADNVFITDVKVLDVSTKALIKSASSQGEGVASILKNQIDDLSEEISQGIGLSEQHYKTTHVELAEVTTSSMEAYRHFLQGRENVEKSYWEDALPFLKKAIELDSTFSMAYLYLSRAYDMIYFETESARAFDLAKKYSYKATEKERLYIEAAKLHYSLEKVEEQFHVLNEMAIKYPKEKRVHYKIGNYYLNRKMLDDAIIALNKSLELDPSYGAALKLLAHTFVNTGNYNQALETLEKYCIVAPGNVEPIVAMGDVYYHMGKLDEAILKYEESIRIKPEYYNAYKKISFSYALMEDYDKALSWISSFHKNAQAPGPKAEAIWYTAYFQNQLGQFNQSISTINASLNIARELNADFAKGLNKFLMGYIYYKHQEYDSSQLYFKNAFNHWISDDPLPYLPFYQFYVGIIHLKQGRIDSVSSALSKINSLFPELKEQYPWWEEPMKNKYHLLQAEMLLTVNRAQQAISIAEKTFPEQIPMIPGMHCLFNNVPSHHDVLARAYHQAGDLDKAISEYERLIRLDPNSRDRRLIHPTYHYHLAEFYEEKDLTEKALAQYQRFLELWKNADQDLPELVDAKNRVKLLTGN
jgi:serine/threonine protein kinase/cytochrome c-type biogenesis protein CcmH/NrfG